MKISKKDKEAGVRYKFKIFPDIDKKGKGSYFTVMVFDTKDNMNNWTWNDYHKHGGGSKEAQTAAGACYSFVKFKFNKGMSDEEWQDVKPEKECGKIALSLEKMCVEIVNHELFHAATQYYSQKVRGEIEGSDLAACTNGEGVKEIVIFRGDERVSETDEDMAYINGYLGAQMYRKLIDNKIIINI